MQSTKLARWLAIIAELRMHKVLSAGALAKKLQKREGQSKSVCSRTIRRDIAQMQSQWDCPIEYKANKYGYILADGWSVPVGRLTNDVIFASFLCNRLGADVTKGELLASVLQVQEVQLQMSDPGEIDLDAVNSVVFATSGEIELNRELFDVICSAWRHCKVLDIDYQTRGEIKRRTIEIHVLFLRGGVWYARAYCCLREEMRTFALHRISRAELLEKTFLRSAEIVAEARNGFVFDYDYVANLRIGCSADYAASMCERQWFAGQNVKQMDNGMIELSFPWAPEPVVLQWILQGCGHLWVIAPETFRLKIRGIASAIIETHEGQAPGKVCLPKLEWIW